jgi:uncharacterized protein YdaU (DUF1376 family)
MIFYKHYIGDFQRDTGHLSLAERGAYRAMLDHHYATEQPLPIAVSEICRLVAAQTKIERAAVRRILDEFWTCENTGWVNQRALREIAKAAHQREINGIVGKRGGRPRNSNVKPNENRIGFEIETETKPNNNPSHSQTSLLRKAANAADGKAGNEKTPSSTPCDPKTWLFRDGLTWLTESTGRNVKGLRSQLGRWLRDTKEDAEALRTIFQSAKDNAVAEPVAWITAAISARSKAASPFEPTDDHGWRNRFRSYQVNHVWPVAWGGTGPGDHPHHPAHILAEFNVKAAAQ